MLKRTTQFLRNYYLFSVAAVALVVGLVLQFTHYQTYSHLVLGAVAIVEALPLIWRMWQDLRDGTYGIDILAATAIVTSVIMRQDWVAIVIVIMLTGGEALEDYAENRAKTELDALLNKAPKLAHLIKKGQTIDVPISQVKVGDKLIIRPGELVPVDSIIIEGAADFDESSLTGESLPQSKSIGDSLLSGSIDIDGAITIKALQIAADSQYEQIVKLVRAAANSQAPFVRLADRYSIPFTVTAYVIAIVAWVASGQSIRFLDVLVVATPCPLILAVPIAVISGMSRAARHGIIIKNGGALERLAEAQTVAFDKTGTLTQGKLVVSEVKTFNGHNTQKVLGAAAALEKNSNHVLADAIIEAASKKNIKIPKTKNVKEEPGSGLMATVAAKTVLVGRQSFLQKHNVKFPTRQTSYTLSNTSAFVAIDGELAGIIGFKDELRPETKSTIQKLSDLGIKHLLMITGDNLATAKAIAKKIGIDEIEANTLPADKLRIVEKLENRPVVFVGDGVNDAPVLTASDVGIALGARGETAASESADMVIMQDDLGRVARVMTIAQRTFSIARQSILIGIALSVILMLIFSTGHFRPLYGAIIQEVVDVIVIFNALRAHTEGKKLKELK